ncbi:putative capsid protein [Avon-Heathcote Estuary associated circular virus 12]|uniref:putative capsid protein n=1 Tax=Avon-Heathcote Estuary associated circular virus 12 TaxID=1618235 RepID=UPI0005CCE5FF|nr:putative capsid protein [Avon-Heathcote Estuary associated circular virus 12]AJP36408.1 putative capsid protein [Avon-Heathcote Estuary associated circular virus 12]
MQPLGLTMSGKAKQTINEFDIKGNNTLVGVPQMAVMDTAYCLSKLNHRLYRQGRAYTVRVEANQDSFGSTESIEVFALMPTWYLRSAWRMPKKAYDEAMADELASLNPENVARWRDFRVGSGITLTGTTDALEFGGAVPNLWQLDETGVAPVRTPFTAGEYNLSYAHNLDTGVNMQWWLKGGDATHFGVFEEYSKSRNESASPETVIQSMPYEALEAEGEDEDYEEVQANGNEPPYNANAFPNGIWVRVGVLEKSTSLTQRSTGFFHAPLGMVAF